jgi:hypothetical protein
MADDEDGDLRRSFAALRRHEAGAAPPFRRAWAAALAGRRRPRARFAVAAVALAFLALLWLRPGPAPEPMNAPPVARWQSPTDFLLRTPGRELLSAVPALARPAIPGLSLPARSPEPSNRLSERIS